MKSVVRSSVLRNRAENAWLDLLPFAASAYNRTPHPALGNVSPYEMIYGRKYPMLSDAFENSRRFNENFGQYVIDLNKNLRQSWEIAREYDRKMKEEREEK